MKYPGTVGTQTYTYDTNNQHATTKIPGLAANNDTLAHTYRWNAIATTTMPGNLTRTVMHDPLQRPTKIEVKGTGNLGIPVLNHRYEYDAVSNITKKTTLDGIYEYGYDALDRLTDANPPDNLEAGANGLPVESYDYDGVHNRVLSTHQVGPWVYSANNELNTWGIGDNRRVLTYDDNGSTTKEVLGEPASKTTDYVYDAQDRLIEVKNNNLTVANYAYDPMGRRIWRETFGVDASMTWFLYSDEGLLGEYNQNGAAIREYGWSPGGLWGTDPVWQKDSSGTYLAHNDHLFTTDKLTKASDGRVAWTGVREAFGKTSVAANSQMTYLLRFPGQWEDKGLVNNYIRNFAPESGRYLQPDQLPFDGESSYSYSKSSPTRFIDPLGLFTIHANEIFNFGGNETCEWKFRVFFYFSCTYGVSPEEDIAGRGVRWIKRLRSARKLIEDYSGDNDSNDLCACRKYDSELQTLYEGKGYSVGGFFKDRSVLNRAELDELLLIFKKRVEMLNKKPDCKTACIYPWAKLADYSVDRSISRSINGNCRKGY